MNVAVALISMFTLVFAFAGYMTVVTNDDYPANPLKWRSERRRRVEQATVRRISALEHDLGYIPCSNDKCYSCKRTFDTKYVPSYANEFIDLIYDKEIEARLWK